MYTNPMIDLNFLKNKKVAVLGLAKSGLAACRALSESNVNYVAWDDSEEKRKTCAADGIRIAKDMGDFLSNTDLVVLSPGIPHTLPKPHLFIAGAKAKNIDITSDIFLFRHALPDAEIVSVTGTNGKSTTTTLMGHVLSKKLNTQIGGNIGIPALSLESNKNVTVFEMSSYQIELTGDLNAHGVIWLNISPDHIDRHGSMEGYVEAKKRIFERNAGHGLAVIGVDDLYSKSVADEITARPDWTVITVSVERMLDKGISVIDGQLYVDGEHQIDVSKLPTLKGVHNHQNAACVYVIARNLYDFSNEDILAQLMSFDGLAHRQFVVGKRDNVTFINDSKATNFEATAKALSSFKNIYLIAGGQAKEGGLSGIEDYRDRIAKIYLIGEAENAFADFLDNKDFDYVRCGTLDKAVKAAFADAKSSDIPATVLLSPACASWDQYNSFEHRGAHFEEIVASL